MGKFMNYIHWCLRRLVKQRVRLAADATTGICITRIVSEQHESGVAVFEKTISTNLGTGVDKLCRSVRPATVMLPQYRMEPDSSYVPLISHILRISYDRKILPD
jgi:hypothetical protein